MDKWNCFFLRFQLYKGRWMPSESQRSSLSTSTTSTFRKTQRRSWFLHTSHSTMISKSIFFLLAVLAFASFTFADETLSTDAVANDTSKISILGEINAAHRQSGQLTFLNRRVVCRCLRRFRPCLRGCLNRCNNFNCAIRCNTGCVRRFCPRPCWWSRSSSPDAVQVWHAALKPIDMRRERIWIGNGDE